MPIKGKRFNDLKGDSFNQFQIELSNIKYLIIRKYSFIGQIKFVCIDRGCKQATSEKNELFRNLSIILVGDISQLPPV